MRKKDPELSEKYNRLYQSSRDLDNTVDDVITYISNIKRNDEVFVRAKKLLYPMEDILLESVQSARVSTYTNSFEYNIIYRYLYILNYFF